MEMPLFAGLRQPKTRKITPNGILRVHGISEIRADRGSTPIRGTRVSASFDCCRLVLSSFAARAGSVRADHDAAATFWHRAIEPSDVSQAASRSALRCVAAHFAGQLL